MNLTSRESELRTVAYGEMSGQETQTVKDIYVAESENGLMVEIHSKASRFGRMADVIASVLRGLTPEGESVHVLYVSDDRLARINSDSNVFTEMSDAQQRLHVSHSLRLGDN